MAPRLRRRTLLVALFIALGIVVLWRVGMFSIGRDGRLMELQRELRSRPGAPLIFVGLYGVAAALMVPVTPLTLAGGLIFGTLEGILLNWCADMLAAALAFALVRGLGWGVRRGDLTALPTDSFGFLPLLRLRLIPVAPFALLNIGAASYGMSWKSYLGATAIGIIPTTIIYTWFAASVAAGVAGSNARALTMASVAGGLIILISFAPRLMRARPTIQPNARDERS
jgi:uncharacterized membrane protein YdjX (TVP38/TMEM64 family)